MANARPSAPKEIKSRFLLNPFIWFSVVWAFVLIIHSFNFTTAYPATSSSMMTFLIIIIAVSIFLAFAFDYFFLKKLKVINISDKPIWGLIAFVYLVLVVECIYSKQVPLISSVFYHSTTYKDFGIPTFSPFMYTFTIFLSLICSLKLVFGQKHKLANFLALLASTGRFIIVYSRGGAIVCVLFAVVLYLTTRKFNWKSVIALLVLAIVGLYLFNITGNIRMGYSSNDSSYLMEVSQFNPKYDYLSDFSWGIVYMDSPLGNLLYNEANVAPLNSFDGLFSQLLPVFISKRLFPAYSGDLVLALPNLTVSTMFAGGYKYYGYFGMAVIYINMVVIIFLSAALCKKRNFALVGCCTLLTILSAMSFFDDMFARSGNSLALIYLIIFIYLFYKQDKSNSAIKKVEAKKPEVIEEAKPTEPVKKTPSIAKNSIFYLFYSVFNAIFPFLSSIYVARVLSTTTIGDISYALNIVGYFAIFAFVGIPTYGMREIAKHRDDQKMVNKIYSELFIINAITTTISLVCYIALVFLVPSFRNEHLVLYLVLGIEIALNYFNNDWLYEGLERFSLTSIFSVATKLLSFVFLVLFVKSEENSLIYAILSVIGISGNYIFSFIFHGKYAKFTREGLEFKKHIKPILLLVVVNLAIEIYSMLDITMIGAIMPDKAHVAYYKYAYQIQKTLLMAVNTITMVLVPRLSKLYKDKKVDEYNGLLSKAFSIILLVAIPMIIGIYFVSDALIVWIYGDSFATSSTILKILSLIVLISPIGYLLGSRVCLVTNNEKYMPIAVGIGALVNIGLNAWFINVWGEIGAAIASVISEIIILVAYLSFSHKYFKLKVDWKNMAKIGLALVLMSAYLTAIYFLVNSQVLKVVLEICGAIAIYLVTLLISKENNLTNLIARLKNKRKNKVANN